MNIKNPTASLHHGSFCSRKGYHNLTRGLGNLLIDKTECSVL